MMKSITGVAALLCLGCAYAVTVGSKEPKVQDSGEVGGVPAGGHLIAPLDEESCGVNLSSEWVPHVGFDSDVAVQYLERSEAYPEDGVLLSVSERLNATAEWDQGSSSYTTTYDVLELGALDEGDYLVAGEARNGDLIVERWVVQPSRGGWVGRAAVFTNSQVFGGSSTPAPGSSPPVLNGPTFIPPTQRPNPPAIDRFELYRGALTALPIHAIAGDGLGGKALLLAADASAGLGELWEISLDGGGAQLVANQASAPGLATCNFIDVHYSDTGVWAFTCLAYAGIVGYSGLYGTEEQHYVFERNAAAASLVGPIVFTDEPSWKQAYGAWHWPNGRQ